VSRKKGSDNFNFKSKIGIESVKKSIEYGQKDKYLEETKQLDAFAMWKEIKRAETNDKIFDKLSKEYTRCFLK
jgi:hypothetical protein